MNANPPAAASPGLRVLGGVAGALLSQITKELQQ